MNENTMARGFNIIKTKIVTMSHTIGRLPWLSSSQPTRFLLMDECYKTTVGNEIRIVGKTSKQAQIKVRKNYR